MSLAIEPEYSERFRTALKTSAGSIVGMAQVASEVHEKYGYQGYVTWLKREFDVSRQTGDNLLRVFRKLISTPNFSVTDLQAIAPSALYLLASPSTPEPVVAEALADAKAGKPVTHKKVKEKIAKAKPAKEPEKPTVVTVQRVEPATDIPVSPPEPAKPVAPDPQPWNEYNADARRIIAIAAELKGIYKRMADSIYGDQIDAAQHDRFCKNMATTAEKWLVARWASDAEKKKFNRPFLYVFEAKKGAA